MLWNVTARQLSAVLEPIRSFTKMDADKYEPMRWQLKLNYYPEVVCCMLKGAALTQRTHQLIRFP
jgi:hypothetical protein